VTVLVIVYSLVAILISLLLCWVFARFTRLAEFAMVAAIVWAAAAVATAIWLPGGSYLAAWPALFALGGMLITSAATRAASWLQVIAVLVFSAPLLLIVPPSVVLFFTALTVDKAFVVAPLIVMGVWLLYTCGCIPLLIAAPSPPTTAKHA